MARHEPHPSPLQKHVGTACFVSGARLLGELSQRKQLALPLALQTAAKQNLQDLTEPRHGKAEWEQEREEMGTGDK